MAKANYVDKLLCFVLGCGCLFAWNTILTVMDYYTVLFPHYHPSRVLPIVYQPLALFTLVILSYNEAKINAGTRILFGYILFFAASLAVLLLDIATTGNDGIGTCVGICAGCGVYGIADAHVQGGMVGEISSIAPELVQSFLAGLAASGCFTSLLRVITKASFQDSRDGLRRGTILFLAISTFFELTSVLLYAFAFPRLPVVRHHRARRALDRSEVAAGAAAVSPQGSQVAAGVATVCLKKLFEEESSCAIQILSEEVPEANDGGIQTITEEVSEESSGIIQTLSEGDPEAPTVGAPTLPELDPQAEEPLEQLSNRQLLGQNYDYAIQLVVIYAISLAIFPGFLSEDTGRHGLGSWYISVLIAVFNVGDLIGRIIPLVESLTLTSRRVLMAAALSRSFFIPAFLFTAKLGDKGWMLMLTTLLGLSNGYLTVCVLATAPKGYKREEQNANGDFLVLCLTAGILAGVGLGWLWLIGKGW